MPLGVDIGSEVDNIIERVDITDGLMVPRRHPQYRLISEFFFLRERGGGMVCDVS